MKKPYENKSDFDPGRFRSTIAFEEQVAVDDGSGGTDVSYQTVYVCKAIDLPLREGSQLVIDAGASILNQDRYFIIRYTTTFTPLKDMNVTRNSEKFKISAVIPLDEPRKYYKILCIRQNG